MSNEQLRQATGVATTEKPATFPAMLARYKDEIARALPRHINPDRMARIALTCFRETPKLAQCAPASVFAAVIKASQLGLEPGLNGRCYLIPYENRRAGTVECQMVPGWKGLLELVNRAGRATAWTGAVFDGDKFDYQLGDSPFARHQPGNEDDPAKLLHTYAIGRIRGNEWPIIEVWPNEKLLRHRNRYNKVGKIHYSYENWEMYARKIPLLQVLKYLPSSPELEQAIALSDAADAGVSQGLTIDAAIAGTYEPPVTTGNGDGRTDPETGEITRDSGSGSGPGATFASIAEAIKKATSTDELDVAKDLMRSIADEKQRAELDVEERAKRRALRADDNK